MNQGKQTDDKKSTMEKNAKKAKESKQRIENIVIESEEDLEKLIEELTKEGGTKQVIIKGMTMNLVQNPILDMLLHVVLTFGLLIACIGYFKVMKASSLAIIALYVGLFAILDYGLKKLCYHRFSMAVILSFGSVLGFISIALLIVLGIIFRFIFGMTFANMETVIVVGILFLVVRSIITTYIRRRKRI